MTDLHRRTAMLDQLATFTDAERLDLLACVVDDLFRYGLRLGDLGECMARNVDRIHTLGAGPKGGGND